jgi:hypothetical protein
MVGLWLLSPKSMTWNVAGLTVTARYRPVGRWAPRGTGAFSSLKFPVMTTRYAGWPALPGTMSPGVASRSASARVVETALMEEGFPSPLCRASRSMAVLSAGIAEAGIPGVAALAKESAVREAAAATAMPAAATHTAVLRRHSTRRNLRSDTSVLPDVKYTHRIVGHEPLA